MIATTASTPMLFDCTSDCRLTPKQHKFEYSIRIDGIERCINHITQIPPSKEHPIDEIVPHICATNDVRPMLMDEIDYEFRKWVDAQTQSFECEHGDNVINSFLEMDDQKQPDLENFNPPQAHDASAQIFAEQFQFVMHNSEQEKIKFIISCEKRMEEEMTSLIRARDFELERMQRQCEQAMKECEIVESGDNAQILERNAQLISNLNEQIREVGTCYTKQIQQLISKQRDEYRNLIRGLYERDELPHLATPNASASRFSFTRVSQSPKSSECSDSKGNRIDESYTIYLGAQLKTMHNSRIISCSSPLDICRSSATAVTDIFDTQHLQMNLALYGRELTALVLLVGQNPSQHLSERTEFGRLCERSTELHFTSLEQQLSNLNGFLRNTKRKAKNKNEEAVLDVGDVYITHHSNLPTVQVVFHLVVDETVESGDINSRHPCINGLRNAFSLASKCGITKLYIPLLLTEKSSNKTTTAWCMKRAELIFKCSKGFMMEACSGSSSAGVPTAATHYNINFMVPNGLDSEAYTHILELFPSIFHLVPSVTV